MQITEEGGIVSVDGEPIDAIFRRLNAAPVRMEVIVLEPMTCMCGIGLLAAIAVGDVVTAHARFKAASVSEIYGGNADIAAAITGLDERWLDAFESGWCKFFHGECHEAYRLGRLAMLQCRHLVPEPAKAEQDWMSDDDM